MKTGIEHWRDFCYYQHDVEVNQKYGKDLPYSSHLHFVEQQGLKFIHLLPDAESKELVLCALIGHDLIEDARLTYNDVKDAVRYQIGATPSYSEAVADIIYCVTDEKGKNRKERKSDKFYIELKANELAVFVKLCDMAANILYGKLTGSKMYDMYKRDFPAIKDRLYIPEYDELFTYIENL